MEPVPLEALKAAIFLKLTTWGQRDENND